MNGFGFGWERVEVTSDHRIDPRNQVLLSLMCVLSLEAFSGYQLIIIFFISWVGVGGCGCLVGGCG